MNVSVPLFVDMQNITYSSGLYPAHQATQRLSCFFRLALLFVPIVPMLNLAILSAIEDQVTALASHQLISRTHIILQYVAICADFCLAKTFLKIVLDAFTCAVWASHSLHDGWIV